MKNQEKNLAKAVGGAARAKALSPERRRETAQKAAASRWGAAGRPMKKPAQKEFLKVARVRHLTVTSQVSKDSSSLEAITISESGQVLRMFSGSVEQVESYLAALSDLGLELVLSHIRVPSVVG